MSYRVTLLDLDNCISDDRWRCCVIKRDADNLDDMFDDYHQMSRSDSARNLELTWCLPEDKLYIVTARPHRYEEITTAWLDKKGIAFTALRMRPDGNIEDSVVVKTKLARSIMEEHPTPGVRFVGFDDRQPIVDAYKALGIEASRVCVHDYDLEDGERERYEVDLRSDLAQSEKEREKREQEREKERKHEQRYEREQEREEQAEAAKQIGVPEILESGAATFKQRATLYGDNYKTFGQLLRVLLPDGVHADKEEDLVRLGLLVCVCTKVARYCASIKTGGHKDSAHDLMVYAAMLEEMTP